MIPEKASTGQTPKWIGTKLSRPECVVAHCSGLLLVPNWAGNGGISVISPTGVTHHILTQCDEPVRPNGIALEEGGTVLLAHMGTDDGGIFRLKTDGGLEPVVLTANGQPLPPTNFVVQDSAHRIWITVSTRKTPRADDYRASACSGFIAVAEAGSTDATIVADGLGYTNECVIDEHRACVWVNETFGRRLTRFNLRSNQRSPVRLDDRQVVHVFGSGTYPDGLALDESGCLWVTSIISNRILRVTPDGRSQLIHEDSDKAHLDWTESAFRDNRLGREHLDKACSLYMQNLSNLAFGGPDRKRLYLGNLLGDKLPYFDSDVCGAPMPHWDVDLGPLKAFTYRTHDASEKVIPTQV